MTTISKREVKRINDLLGDASLYELLATVSRRDGKRDDYFGYRLKEGLAVRALFNEFGIEAKNIGWFTEEKITELRTRVADQSVEQETA